MSPEPEVRVMPRAGVAPPTHLPAVLLHERARDEMDDHVSLDTSVESGGILVGRHQAKTNRVIIAASIPATRAVGAVSSLTFTHEAWDEVNDRLARDFPDQQVVGWYHSHPHFGIFLSEYDLFIHRNFFAEPWQVAYVVDPLLGQAGFFGWSNGEIERMSSWYVRAGQTARIAPQRPTGALDGLPTPAAAGKDGAGRVRLVLGIVAVIVAIVIGYALHQPRTDRAVGTSVTSPVTDGYRVERTVATSGGAGTLTLAAERAGPGASTTAPTITECAPTALEPAPGTRAVRSADPTWYDCPLGGATGARFEFTGTAQEVLSAAASLSGPQLLTLGAAEACPIPRTKPC